jgi:hypothetical protein
MGDFGPGVEGDSTNGQRPRFLTELTETVSHEESLSYKIALRAQRINDFSVALSGPGLRELRVEP